MIVNYIDIDFTASTIQEDFNNATKMAILTVWMRDNSVG